MRSVKDPEPCSSSISTSDGALPKRNSIKRNILLSIVASLFAYMLFESAFSTLFSRGLILSPYTSGSLWVFEDSQETIHFDPIRGYRLMPVPSRFARITNGVVEYVGTFCGNAQGFPDRDDFSPDPEDRQRVRIAVLGDSFTAAQYLTRNWPDAVEDMAKHSASIRNVELLNFSVDGGGLANWWSILMRFIKPEGYAIDGILFAVYGNDLNRGFSIAEHRGSKNPMFGRVQSWNPGEWPRNVEEAGAYLAPLDGHIVSTKIFERAIQLEWKPRIQKPWRPIVTLRILDLLSQIEPEHEGEHGSNLQDNLAVGHFQPAQANLIDQIARYAQDNSLEIMVVMIPSKNDVINRIPPSSEILEFKARLSAHFVDGGDAFADISEKEIDDHWFPSDGHWAQIGSDRFATFISGALQRWADDLHARRLTSQEAEADTTVDRSNL